MLENAEVEEVSEEPADRKELLEQQFDAIEQEGKPEVRSRPRVEREEPETPQAEPVWKRPPASWKKDFHETWASADPKFQEYAYQREEQMRAGVEPLISKAQWADTMNEAIAPFMQTLQGMNLDAPTAVRRLMEADNILRTSPHDQKVQYFNKLAREYGINLGDVSTLPQQGYIDPNVYALQNELNNVRGEVQGWKQQQEAQQNQVLLGEINQFAQQAEHFEEARPTMIQLLNSGMATDLDDAYEKAIRLDNGLFSSVQQAQQASAEQQRRVSANKAAKSARAAAVSVRSSTPGTHTATKAQNRRSLLEEQFADIAERL
jgi:hypothetical protein